MLYVGPISSIYDFVTFWVLLEVFHASGRVSSRRAGSSSPRPANARLFVIRTAGNPFRSRPSAPLAITTVAVVVVGSVIPFSPVAATLGFVRLPGSFFVFVIGVVGCYLVCVEVVKRWLFRRRVV